MGKLIEKYRRVPKEGLASVWYTICSVLQKSIGLITVPIFTRLLTTEDYGLTNVYSTWMSLAVIFTTMNLQYGSFNKAMVKFENDRDRYISSVQSLVTLITLALFCVYAFFDSQVNGVTGLTTALTAAMALQIVVDFSFGLWIGKRRFDYEYKSVVALTLATSIVVPVVGVIMVLSVQDGRGEMKIFSAVLVQAICYGALYVYNLVKGRCVFDKSFWKYALGMNVALVPYYLSQMAFNSSDLLMINWICGMADAGLYGVVYSIALVLTFVLNAINNSFVPWKYRKFKEHDYEDVPGVTSGIALLVACMMLLLILAAPEIIKLLAAPQYFDARWIVPPVSASLFFLFLTQVFVDVEFYFEDKLMLVCGSVLGAVANIVLNALLLPVFGYIVAGYTTLVSFIIFFIANWACTRRTLKKFGDGMKIDDFCDIKQLLIIGAILVAAMLACVGLYHCDIARYAVLVFGLIAIIVFRKRIISAVKLYLGR